MLWSNFFSLVHGLHNEITVISAVTQRTALGIHCESIKTKFRLRNEHTRNVYITLEDVLKNYQISSCI